ncbi:uncharacterized protein MONBRDRAFT_29815 [Monosiga brevicollis MX1]|uniref:PIF1/LRR1 pleckstrin homology domain-containing protein n=1 Tax=Monosiga brevicollis TaxID=81824 RepID=A9VC73_MONBE|nr:uncharacterized protein MONBRDRAFT_29815 [Monosiga brevicollis MX1]EDQ84811.1 predicted protein [Monosiga brevicollis MX1]|eukprot:XP_001750312.1 hypothetical protein [Monosiga brevicollis MX1]
MGQFAQQSTLSGWLQPPGPPSNSASSGSSLPSSSTSAAAAAAAATPASQAERVSRTKPPLPAAQEEPAEKRARHVAFEASSPSSLTATIDPSANTAASTTPSPVLLDTPSVCTPDKPEPAIPQTLSDPTPITLAPHPAPASAPPASSASTPASESATRNVPPSAKRKYAPFKVLNCQTTFYLHSELGHAQGSRPVTTNLYLCAHPAGPARTSRKVELRRVTKLAGCQTWTVSQNHVEHVFAKFRQEGRCTIRLRQPPVDLIVSHANPSALSGFLDSLYAVHTGDEAIDLPSPGRLNELTKEGKDTEAMVKRLRVSRGQDIPRVLPPNLRSLHLSDRALSRPPAQIFRCAHLSVLDLSQNKLQKVPLELELLPELRSLDLSSNEITAWPAHLVLPTLQSLMLSSNKLETLPRSLGRFTNLHTLHLEHNQLGSVPTTIGLLPHLRNLQLRGNRLGCLPASFAKFQGTRRLALFYGSDNPWRAADEEVHILPGTVPSLFEAFCLAQPLEQVRLSFLPTQCLRRPYDLRLPSNLCTLPKCL